MAFNPHDGQQGWHQGHCQGTGSSIQHSPDAHGGHGRSSPTSCQCWHAVCLKDLVHASALEYHYLEKICLDDHCISLIVPVHRREGCILHNPPELPGEGQPKDGVVCLYLEGDSPNNPAPSFIQGRPALRKFVNTYFLSRGGVLFSKKERTSLLGFFFPS